MKFSMSVDIKAHETSSATAGKAFDMNKVRTFTGETLYEPENGVKFSSTPYSCDKWAVVTSIFDPTETVEQLAGNSEWCVVVVGDKNGPKQYDLEGVVYLTPEDQEQLPYKIVQLLPWNHFGRKNIGYLYAIHHGANIVYDVDDDNSLIFAEDGIPYTESMIIEMNTFVSESFVHNPYGCFGGPENVWPRGYPLDNVNTEYTQCQVYSTGEQITVGVIQSLANHDPDVDAIYRLTHPSEGLPFDFYSGKGELKVVPPKSYTPYNAQATLHFPPAFWGMLLPVTVHGRVSDIWRSYFTQTLLPSTGSVVAFAKSWVQQFRNPHNYLADFQSELPLYERSGALVKFLQEFSKVNNVKNNAFSIGMVEKLSIEMYEYGIIEELDVKLTQAWIMDLYSIGYEYE